MMPDKSKWRELFEKHNSIVQKKKEIERYKAEAKEDAETYWFERNLRIRNSLKSNVRY